MNNNQGLRVRTEIVKRYYVEAVDGWIYGGPFDTKEEARSCLKEARQRGASNPLTVEGTTAT
jgi:hypothetical protein